jgi:glutathione S-transferase
VIVLYEHPLSPYSQKCKTALAEKNVQFELRLPERFGTGSTTDRGFIERNLRHEVPALVDGEARIFDSTIILEYIEEKWPRPPLMPKDPAERARVRMIEDVMDTQYEAINWGIMEVVRFKRAEGKLRDGLLEAAAAQTAKAHAWLDKELGNREWFNGAMFGWADLAVIPHLLNSARFGNAPKDGSHLADWLARASARPSVAAMIGQAKDWLKIAPDVTKLLASGSYRRQYRDHRLEWMLRSGGLPIVLEGLENKTVRFSNEMG